MRFIDLTGKKLKESQYELKEIQSGLAKFL